MDQVHIAVLNSSKEITDVVSQIFRAEGFSTSTSFTYLYKNNEEAFDNFLKKNKPSVIIYDVALPYEQNYELFRSLSKRDLAKDIPIILTTTNKKALESLVGKTKTYELIGKPYDLKEIVNAVRRVLKAQE